MCEEYQSDDSTLSLSAHQKYDPKCIWNEYRCDGEIDCKAGTDESYLQCSKYICLNHSNDLPIE